MSQFGVVFFVRSQNSAVARIFLFSPTAVLVEGGGTGLSQGVCVCLVRASKVEPNDGADNVVHGSNPTQPLSNCRSQPISAPSSFLTQSCQQRRTPEPQARLRRGRSCRWVWQTPLPNKISPILKCFISSALQVHNSPLRGFPPWTQFATWGQVGQPLEAAQVHARSKLPRVVWVA